MVAVAVARRGVLARVKCRLGLVVAAARKMAARWLVARERMSPNPALSAPIALL